MFTFIVPSGQTTITIMFDYMITSLCSLSGALHVFVLRFERLKKSMLIILALRSQAAKGESPISLGQILAYNIILTSKTRLVQVMQGKQQWYSFPLRYFDDVVSFQLLRTNGPEAV